MTNEPIYAIPEMDLYYRAPDHETFLAEAPVAWTRELTNRIRRARHLYKALGSAALPLRVPSSPEVRAAGIKGDRPLVTIDGESYPVTVYPPDHFSPRTLYTEAMRTEPGSELHAMLLCLAEAEHPRVRISKQDGLPIVLDEEGHPLNITAGNAAYSGAWKGVSESPGYFPIWDPPFAWLVLRRILRPKDASRIERAIWNKLGKKYRPSNAPLPIRYRRIAELAEEFFHQPETTLDDVQNIFLCAQLMAFAAGHGCPAMPTGYAGDKREDNQG